MKTLDMISDALSFLCKIVACAALLCMMALTCIDVFLRLLWRVSILGVYDIVQLLMGFVVFAGFVVTQRSRGMLHATFLLKSLPGKLKYIVWASGYALATAVCIGWGMGAMRQGYIMMIGRGVTSTIRIPIFPYYYMASIFLFFLSFVMIVETIKTIFAVFNEKYAKEMREQWTS